MSPRALFEQELKVLKDSIAQMSLRVEEIYEELFLAIEKKDEETMRILQKSDREIGEMERNIESKCLTLITKQQPIARDLRLVTAGLKAVTDLERAGDHVSDIAELSLRMGLTSPSVYSAHMDIMVIATKEMLHESVLSFVERNEKKAQEVIKGDDVVDELFSKVKEDLIKCLQTETGDPDNCIDTLMIAKYLEKIADHAVNIAQWEVFQETGTIDDIRLL